MCNKTFYFLQFYAFIRENLREYKLNLCYGSMREVRVFHEQYKVSKKGSVCYKTHKILHNHDKVPSISNSWISRLSFMSSGLFHN